MTSRAFRSFVTSITLAGVVLQASPSVAQPRPQPAQVARPRPALADSLAGDAKASYESGKLLYEDGDFAGATSKFKQAYDLSKDVRLLWNMAAAEKNQRHYYRVQVLVQRYVTEGKGIITADQETAAQELLEAIKSFIAVLKIESNEDGARVAIDGQPVATTPVTDALPIDLGTHKISVTKPGFTTFTKELDVTGGTLTPLIVELASESHVARLAITAGTNDTIALDGAVMAKGRWEDSIPSGTHLVRVTAPGMKAYELRLDLLDKSTRTVQVTLEKDKAALWPWIAGGAVLVAGAVVGGYFLLKPNDQPASQPAGTLSPGVINLSGHH